MLVSLRHGKSGELTGRRNSCLSVGFFGCVFRDHRLRPRQAGCLHRGLTRFPLLDRRVERVFANASAALRASIAERHCQSTPTRPTSPTKPTSPRSEAMAGFRRAHITKRSYLFTGRAAIGSPAK